MNDSGEDCDGTDLRGQSCTDLDFDGGVLGCRTDCTWDTTDCFHIELCDDGIDNDGDGDVDCDDADCFDDIEACPRCGDGVINGDDVCDGDAIPTTCEEEGFSHGTIGCTDACEFDLSGCVEFEVCDDGIDNDGDGDTDCEDSDCFDDMEACPRCGDGVINGDDTCDGEEILTTCEEEGFSHGTIGCTDACELDTSGCVEFEICNDGIDNDGDGDTDCDDSDCVGDFNCPVCGDGSVQKGEECEDDVPLGATCSTFGFNSGDLACNGCFYDLADCRDVEICTNGLDDNGDGLIDCDDPECDQVAPCPVCGNGIIEEGEECDDNNTNDDDGCSSTCETEPWLVPSTTGGVSSQFGSIDSNDPLFVRTIVCGSLTGLGQMHYDVHYLLNDGAGPAQVRVDAVYGAQAYLFVYWPSFDPSDAQANCLAGYEIFSAPYEASSTINFPPNTGVYIVATTYNGSAAIGPYTLTATTLSICGDGVISGDEQCDLGDTIDGDGCSSSCQLEPGWVCDATSCRATICGDGIQEGTEECDDNNTNDGDGCNSSCLIEGASCAGAIGLNGHPGTNPNTWVLQDTTTGRSDNFSATCLTTSSVPDMHVSFTAPSDGWYWIEYDTPSDAALTVLDASCNQIACVDDRWDLGSEETAIFLSANQQIILVLDAWASGAITDGPFTLTVVGSTEVEPNDTQATATPYVEPATGSLPVDTDLDYWSFTATAGTSYTVFTSDSGSGTCGVATIDTHLSIFDGSGLILGSNDDIDDWGGNWCSSVTFTAATSETHYALVEFGPLSTGGGLSIPLYYVWVVEN